MYQWYEIIIGLMWVVVLLRWAHNTQLFAGKRKRKKVVPAKDWQEKSALSAVELFKLVFVASLLYPIFTIPHNVLESAVRIGGTWGLVVGVITLVLISAYGGLWLMALSKLGKQTAKK